MQKINRSALFETFFYYLVITLSILTFLFTINLDVRNINIGNDIKIFCNAGAAIAADKNPYLTSNIGGDLSWNYPSIMADAFSFVCPWLNLNQTYIGYFLLPFLLGLLPWLKRRDWLYGFTLLTTGLFNIGWVIITGNVSTFEFLLFSLAVFLLIKNKPNASSFILGVMSGMKVIPILYMPAVIFLQKDVKQKLTALTWSAAGFALIPLLSLITSPKMFPWYIRQLLGLIPDQHAPVNELDISPLNPSLSILVFSFLKTNPATSPTAHLVFSLVIYILGFVLFFMLIKSKVVSEQKMPLLFSIGVILLTLTLPRLKPYSFLPLLLCFYLISQYQSNLLKGIYLVLLSIIPILSHLIYFYVENSDILFESNILQTMLTLNQIFFACIAAGLLIFSILRQARTTTVYTDAPK